MNREQIANMARDAGLTDPDLGDWMIDYGYSEEAITRFAAAIRAATKEEDARICEELNAYDEYDPAETFADAIRASK